MGINSKVTTGRKIVTSTVEVLSGSSARAVGGILIYADENNTQTVWIGGSANMTIDSNDETDGFPLKPGSSITLPVRAPQKIFLCIEKNIEQKCWWAIQ